MTRWIAGNGSLTPLARQVLAELEPRMIERLNGLAASPPAEQASELLRNISQGPLARKWGAMPVALWLSQAAGSDPARLARWIEGGPSRILGLALRAGNPTLRPAFRRLAVRARAERPASQDMPRAE